MSKIWSYAVKQLLVWSAVLFLTSTAWADSPKVSPDLKRGKSGDYVDVIVQFKHTPTSRHYAKVISKGAELNAKLHIVKAGAFKHLPKSALAKLAADPEVAYIAPDRPVHQSSAITLDYYAATVNANYAGSLGLDGTGVGVAILDSGIHNVPDLGYIGKGGSKLVYQQSFVPGQGNDDNYGHGTHVAGIVAGTGNHSTGANYTYTFKGIAPNANLINLRVLDQHGNGTDSTVIAAIQKAISLKSQYNIRVINLSLGRQVYESYTLDPLCQAVEQAWQAGIVVVVAAGNQGRNNSVGNSGYGTIAAPGNDPYVITVGASNTQGSSLRTNDVMTTYSSKGPTAYDHVIKPDLIAPGNRIISLQSGGGATLISANLNNKPLHSLYIVKGDNNPTGDYFMLSGTSMAAPVVSGAAALMLQQDPTLSPDTVKARLMKSAFKGLPTLTTYTDPTTGITYNVQSDIFTIGAGILDIQAALSDTDIVSSGYYATSPVAAYDSTTGSTYLVGGSSVIWGSSVLWGSSVVWGSGVVWGSSVTWGSSVLWGSSVCWGASSSQGFAVVWGSSVLWGSSAQNVSEALDVTVGGDDNQ